MAVVVSRNGAEELGDIVEEIKSIQKMQWISEQEKDLCIGCKYFESSWSLLLKALPWLETLYNDFLENN